MDILGLNQSMDTCEQVSIIYVPMDLRLQIIYKVQVSINDLSTTMLAH